MSHVNPHSVPSSHKASREAARAGQMTSVMRAMASASERGPKVLRVAMLKGGKVVEERVLAERQSVSLGPSEASMFVVPGGRLPEDFKLLEFIGEGYVLNIVEGMTGRLALTTGISEVAALRTRALTTSIKLGAEARGKIVVGDVALLFHFVAKAPAPSRPQLPLSVRGGVAARVDWTLTVIAALSFLLHFGIIGTMYSDWMDAPAAETSVQGLVDMMKKLQPPPVEDRPETQPTPEKDVSVKAASSVKPDVKASSSVSASQTSAKSSAVNDNKAAQLAQRAEQMELSILGSFRSTSSVSAAMLRSEVPPVDLSDAAKSASGADEHRSELNIGPGGAPVQHKDGNGLRDIAGSLKTTNDGKVAGKERVLDAPKFDANVGGAVVSIPVSGADATIASLRGRFRSCYQQGLLTDATMSGKVVVSAKIGPNGEVESANVASRAGLSEAVGACVARAIKNAQFSAPGGSGSQLNVPVSFVQQPK